MAGTVSGRRRRARGGQHEGGGGQGKVMLVRDRRLLPGLGLATTVVVPGRRPPFVHLKGEFSSWYGSPDEGRKRENIYASVMSFSSRGMSQRGQWRSYQRAARDGGGKGDHSRALLILARFSFFNQETFSRLQNATASTPYALPPPLNIRDHAHVENPQRLR